MKQKFLLLMVLYAITMSYIQAQTTPSASEQLPAFSTVIPKLQLLKTGYPKVEEAGKEEVTFTKTGNDVKFVGKKVTDKDLSDKLKNFLIKEGATNIWKDELRDLVGKLSIYAETFELQESIWLPEANIEIYAKVIDLHGYSIKTEPLPWRKSKKENFNSIALTETGAGKAGAKAGDINIVCETIAGTGNTSFLANGGDGEAVFVPEMTITLPQTISNLHIYKFQGCPTEDNSGKFKNWSAAANEYIVAAKFKNISTRVIGGDTKCDGFKTYDGSLSWSDGTLVDALADRRLTFNDATVPGKGGNAGKVTTTARDKMASVASTSGNSGKFLARDKDPNGIIIYGNVLRQPIDSNTFTIKYREHSYKNFTVFSNNIGNIFFEPDSDYNSYGDYSPKNSTTSAFNVPYFSEREKARKFIKDNITQGVTQPADIKTAPYVASIDYLKKRVDDLEIHYSAYFQKDLKQRKELDNELDILITYLDTLDKNANIPIFQKAGVHHKALELKAYRNRNIDASNNVAGYRPLLSLTSTMEYIQNNLKSDLKLYVISDIMASNETQAKAFLDQVPQMLEKLRGINSKLNESLVEQNKVYDDLAVKAVKCDSLTKGIMRPLDSLEKIFKKDGEEWAKTKRNWKKITKPILKVGALACSLIPYGQPVLGQVGGNGLNALADNMDDIIEGENTLGVVGAVAGKIDMSGVMKGLAEKKMKHLKPKGLDYDLEFKFDKKQFEDDLKVYNEKVKNLSEESNRRIKTSQEILGGFSKMSAPPADIEREIAALRDASPEFAKISENLRTQNLLKTVIFSDLSDAVQKDMSIRSNIIKNQIAIINLNEQIGKTEYNKNLEEALHDIRNETLKRLKWVEYQLIKSFEYTTLTPFNEKMPCSEVFGETYRREKATVTPQNIDAFVDKLALAYDAQRKQMSSYILKDPDLNKYKVDDDFARKILLAQDDEHQLGTKGSQLLEELNTRGSVVLDLQSDFVNEIIKPSESHARIKDIKLLDIKFEQELSKTASLQLKLEILDDGVLRNGKELLLFRTGDPNKVSDIWTWEVKNPNQKVEIISAGQSDEYRNLINFLITGQTTSSDKDKISRFTMPPAWSRCRLSIENNNNVKMPKITQVELGLKCDRKVLPTNNDVVLDIKLQDAPIGVMYTAVKSGTTLAKADTLTQNTYQIVGKGTSVGIKITEPEDATMQFDKWHVYSKSRVNAEEYEKDKLPTINMNEDVRIVAAFKKKEVTDNPVAKTDAEANGEADKPVVSSKNVNEKPEDAPKKTITLYESPSADAPVIATEHDMSKIDHVEGAEETNGFIRVVYNGTQEAYMKKE